MDITIETDDPTEVDGDKIKAAVEALNYYVYSVTVVGRAS